METEPVQQSMLSWMLTSLGAFYSLVLPLAGLVCFIATLIILVRGKGSMASAAVVLMVPIPFLIGIFAGIQGAISSYQVIAMSGSTPKPAEIAMGISTALFAPLVGMMLMVPSYLMAVIGTFIRSLLSRERHGSG